jgi:hypothetical protein
MRLCDRTVDQSHVYNCPAFASPHQPDKAYKFKRAKTICRRGKRRGIG